LQFVKTVGCNDVTRVKAIDGEAFFEGLRQREDDLIKQRSPK